MNPSPEDRIGRPGIPVGTDARGAETLVRDPINSRLAAPANDDAAERSVHDAPAEAAQPRTRLIQRVDDRSPERANRQALEDLAAGAAGLAIVFENAPNGFGTGLPATAEAIDVALRDVPLGRTHLRLDAHLQSRATADALVRLLAARRVAPERLDLSFGIDPAAIFAGAGLLRMSIEALEASMPQSLAHFFGLGVPGILLEADSRVFHNAGASEAQELGIMLASTVGYLRMFEEARQPALYAAAHVGFALCVDQDRAATAVKVAALRRLWDRVLDGYSVSRLPIAIHAETSYRMMTAGDDEANAARAVLAVLGAAEAGITTVAALAHVPGMRPPSEASRRTLRTMLSTLLAEYDPECEQRLSGSSFERRVEALCEAAWDELRRIESEGGILASLRDGHVQSRVLASRADRLAAGSAAGATQSVAAQAPRPTRTGNEEDLREGAVFCQRLEPIRWEELEAAAAA